MPSAREVLGLVQAIGQPRVGADLVEHHPRRDVEDFTAPVGDTLVRAILSAMHLHPLE